MLKGSVSADRQALTSIGVLEPDGAVYPFEAILDTGFSGYLTLPAADVQRLKLIRAGERVFRLANGEPFRFEVYHGRVWWHGRASRVLIFQSETTPLLGMSLLWGSRITIDALAGGAVEIEELASGG
ncbi:MAG: clan AA aspartic protease [Acidobacteria bacterium]|nr:clan AA aspartic protease [Acidobacteriota bacterium]